MRCLLCAYKRDAFVHQCKTYFCDYSLWLLSGSPWNVCRKPDYSFTRGMTIFVYHPKDSVKACDQGKIAVLTEKVYYCNYNEMGTFFLACMERSHVMGDL